MARYIDSTTPMPAGGIESSQSGDAGYITVTKEEFALLQSGKRIYFRLTAIRHSTSGNAIIYRYTNFPENWASRVYHSRPSAFPDVSYLNALNQSAWATESADAKARSQSVTNLAIASAIVFAGGVALAASAAVPVATTVDAAVVPASVVAPSATDAAISAGLSGSVDAVQATALTTAGIDTAGLATISAPIASDAAIAGVGLGSAGAAAGGSVVSAIVNAGVDAVESIGANVVTTTEAIVSSEVASTVANAINPPAQAPAAPTPSPAAPAKTGLSLPWIAGLAIFAKVFLFS
jgi:hypothetical protein